jgi:collagen triple helix repeat protein
MKFRRPSGSMVIAIMALVLAMGGSAVAASVITSKQIKDGTIQTKDLSKKALKALKGKIGATGATGAPGPAGPQGPQGAQGVQGLKGDTGARGPSDVYSAADDTGAGDFDSISVTVPEGQYLATAKSEYSSNAEDWIFCGVSSDTDPDSSHSDTSYGFANEDGTSTGDYNTLPNQQVFNIPAGGGTITLSCASFVAVFGSGGVTSFAYLRLSAQQVGAIH